MGDPAYLSGHALGTTQTLAPGSPPLCLHSASLTLTHPISGERLTFTAPPPAWAQV
jgi:tRNA pseudouridine32 synthase/23S rRNA pseudouridine746 synthase